jgi:hypothetical protein
MPWDEIAPRKFVAMERDLDGISRQTMEDHYKLYEFAPRVETALSGAARRWRTTTSSTRAM